mmetsp:Transcript_12423/g.18631  ORF Transcript_12423/g.18631 Transcript_12423/m.18631 type:complete len:281 (+) Transcript_12423:158-1000(+)
MFLRGNKAKVLTATLATTALTTSFILSAAPFPTASRILLAQAKNIMSDSENAGRSCDAPSPTANPGNDAADEDGRTYDSIYPGTSIERLNNVRQRVAELNATEGILDGPWEEVRRKLLWAGGLKDMPDAEPGRGYTGHSFNDFNHVDLCTMSSAVLDNTNDGRVQGIAIGNRLGRGIRFASLPEVGDGGSWTTCQLGAHKDPPQDVAHIQFQSRIAFKLVWAPANDYTTFVLVDDDGDLLAKGTPQDDGTMPPLRERALNYRCVTNSKYSKEADKIPSVE